MSCKQINSNSLDSDNDKEILQENGMIVLKTFKWPHEIRRRLLQCHQLLISFWTLSPPARIIANASNPFVRRKFSISFLMLSGDFFKSAQSKSKFKLSRFYCLWSLRDHSVKPIKCDSIQSATWKKLLRYSKCLFTMFVFTHETVNMFSAVIFFYRVQTLNANTKAFLTHRRLRISFALNDLLRVRAGEEKGKALIIKRGSWDDRICVHCCRDLGRISL